MSREEETKLLDAKIAKLEKLSLLRVKEDIHLRNRFAVGLLRSTTCTPSILSVKTVKKK
jgi:hypothetical protein